MKKWEIKLFEEHDVVGALERIGQYLNEMGQKGWEPASVSLTPRTDTTCGKYIILLKRELPKTTAV